MKRLVITEEERRSILGMHKMAINETRGVLSEQLFKKKKVESNRLKSEDKLEPYTPKEEWEEFLKNDSDMVSLMRTDTSKKYWEMAKSGDTAFAVAALEDFKDTVAEKKWKYVRVFKPTTTTEVIPQEPIVYPAVTLTFPQSVPASSNFFKNNEYTIENLLTNTLKTELFEPISEQLSAIPETPGKPKAYLKRLEIETSCSRIPNTKSSDGKTYSFEQLSKLRNDTAKNYVIEELKKLGVVVDEQTQIVQDYLGDEKQEGARGPAWTGKNEDRPKYEQYKRLIVKPTIVFNNVQREPETEQNETFIETKNFQIVFKDRIPKKPKRKGNGVKLKSGGLYGGKWGSTSCPIFD